MKKFIKGRWFPTIVAIAIIVLVTGIVSIMMLFGWRFTYAPELETSWDAVSAVAAWAGVVASFSAIMVAIWIPKKIADRQDKIALFEKRYAVFTVFYKWYYLSQEILLYASNNDDYRSFYDVLYCDGCGEKLKIIGTVIDAYKSSVYELQKIYFLFPFDYEHNDIIMEFLKTNLWLLIGNSFNAQRDKLAQLLNEPAIKELFDIMQRELSLDRGEKNVFYGIQL